MEKKTSLFSNGLIWFGAAVSIAEILTGTLIAPLGFTKGIMAILLGHLIGCILLFLTGLIGGKTEKSSMETVKLSFGEGGSVFFGALNVIQLIGWTAIMIFSGAAAARVAVGAGSEWIWCLVIGLLIAVWIIIGIKRIGKINAAAMSGLFILTIVLCSVIFKGNGAGGALLGDELSFGAAVEFSVAMPLSWLPLISDYTRNAEKPVAATAVSSIVYFLASSWMFIIGMGAAIFAGETDVALIMVKAGIGIIALIIVVFSTVTTTYLDVYSAGVSSESVSKKIKEKPAAIAVCIIGTVMAIFLPVEEFSSFLYLIGSVFAPMVAILITDFFVLRTDYSNGIINRTNFVIWAFGFLIYRMFMRIDTPVGNSLPVMIIVGIICIVVYKIRERKYA